MVNASAPCVTELPTRACVARPRERLLARGAVALADSELLDLVLGTSGGRSLAETLLERFGGLHGIARATAGELVRVPGMGPARVTALLAALCLGRRVASGERPRGAGLRSAAQVHRLLSPHLRHLDQEVFVGLYLDNRHRVLREVQIAEGGLTACAVQPREVLVPALREGAAALIVAHNHPSGDPAPSPEDVALTTRLYAAAQVLGVRLLDHVVIGDGRYVSLAEEGLLGA